MCLLLGRGAVGDQPPGRQVFGAMSFSFSFSSEDNDSRRRLAAVGEEKEMKEKERHIAHRPSGLEDTKVAL